MTNMDFTANNCKNVMEFLEQNQEKIPKNDISFFQSVLSQFHRKGLSEKQFYWMQKFYWRILDDDMAIAPTAVSAAPSVHWTDQYNYMNLTRMIIKAAETLSYPKITLAVPEDRYGTEIEFLKNQHFPNPAIRVKGGRNYVEVSAATGKIVLHPKFDIFVSQHIWKPYFDFFQTFNDDPVEGAKLQGKIKSACCFCNRELTTPESVTAGYGPICADKYGLPWGQAGNIEVSEDVSNFIDVENKFY